MKGDIQIFDTIPDGWNRVKGALTAPVGFDMICNGKSRFSPDYKIGLVKSQVPQTSDSDLNAYLPNQVEQGLEKVQKQTSGAVGICFSDEPGLSEKLNQLAREQMKLRLLQDVQMDITVCQLEGWEYRSYLQGLQAEIGRFL